MSNILVGCSFRGQHCLVSTALASISCPSRHVMLCNSSPSQWDRYTDFSCTCPSLFLHPCRFASVPLSLDTCPCLEAICEYSCIAGTRHSDIHSKRHSSLPAAQFSLLSYDVKIAFCCDVYSLWHVGSTLLF